MATGKAMVRNQRRRFQPVQGRKHCLGNNGCIASPVGKEHTAEQYKWRAESVAQLKQTSLLILRVPEAPARSSGIATSN